MNSSSSISMQVLIEFIRLLHLAPTIHWVRLSWQLPVKQGRHQGSIRKQRDDSCTEADHKGSYVSLLFVMRACSVCAGCICWMLKAGVSHTHALWFYSNECEYCTSCGIIIFQWEGGECAARAEMETLSVHSVSRRQCLYANERHFIMTTPLSHQSAGAWRRHVYSLFLCFPLFIRPYLFALCGGWEMKRN